MNWLASLSAEWQQELGSARKVLERVPENFDWKPHEKSMTLGRLATHVAEIPSWMAVTLNTDVLDFADGYNPNVCNSREEILQLFDKCAAESKEVLAKATEAQLDENWTMRNGEQVYFTQQYNSSIFNWPAFQLGHIKPGHF